MVLPLIMTLLGMAPQIMSAAGSIWQTISGGGRPQRGRQRAPSRRKWSTRKKVGVGVALGAIATGAGYAISQYSKQKYPQYQAGQSIGSSTVAFGGSAFGGSYQAAGAPGGGQPSGGFTPTSQE